MRSWLMCMEQRELCERVFHISKNGAAKVYRHHPVSLNQLSMDGWLWGDTYRIRRLRMRKRDAQTPYLSSRFGDFGGYYSMRGVGMDAWSKCFYGGLAGVESN